MTNVKTAEVLHRRRETDHLKAELEAIQSKRKEERQEQLTNARRLVRGELESRAKLQQATLELQQVKSDLEKEVNENQRLLRELAARDSELAALAKLICGPSTLNPPKSTTGDTAETPRLRNKKIETGNHCMILSGVI